MIPKFDDLVSQLKARVTDPAKQQLLAQIAADATQVAALALTDPQRAEREAKHIAAQAANLSAAEAAAAQTIIADWIGKVALAGVQAALSRE
jgi:hypothetical protein